MQYDIKIIKVNNVYIQIITDSAINQELVDFFSFRPPGYQFTPAFKNKQWDGFIRLYSYLTGKVYLGLTSHVEEFAKMNNYSLHIDESLLKEEKVSEEKVRKFAELMNLHAKGEKITPRDYQLYAVWSVINEERKIVLSPTSSGKSAMIYILLRWYQMMKRKKMLIIVPTVGLTTQMFADFDDYSSKIDWSAENNVHKISAGADKNTDKFCTVSTWQSLVKMPKQYFDQFDVVIVDEAHLSKGKSISGILEKCLNAEVKVGFTGTLGSKSVHHLVLEGLFGKHEQIITTNELMQRGEVAELDIKCLNLEYPDTHKKACRNLSYQEEIDHIIGYEKRNNVVCDLIQSQVKKGKNVLVLFNKIAHGKTMLDNLEKRNMNNNNYMVTGKMKADERELIRTKIESEKGSVILGSYGVFSTGVSIRNLNVVIFGSPSKSEIRVLQSIGRGLRKSDIKDNVTLFDVVDNIKHKKHVNYTLQHFLSRLEIYAKEQFNYSFINIKL